VCSQGQLLHRNFVDGGDCLFIGILSRFRILNISRYRIRPQETEGGEVSAYRLMTLHSVIPSSMRRRELWGLEVGQAGRLWERAGHINCLLEGTQPLNPAKDVGDYCK